MEELVFFYPENHAGHFERGHPERPERVEALVSGLRAAGWWEAFPHLEPEPVPTSVMQEVHLQGYLQQLQAASVRGMHLDGDTYTTPDTWDLAFRAAGGAIAVAQAVWEGRARRGFALTRPPGHHATPYRGMGFCLLNNIALAAEDLVQKGAKRLAIVDLDLHHGNGTQDVFWKRGDVFFLSTHQSPLYPGTGALEETGAGPGEGATANLPLPPGSGDSAFKESLETWILPLVDRFAPEMLLVSFGFDPHWRDPLGALNLSAGVYGELIAALTAWADRHCAGRIALFLEGGYDLKAAQACGQAVTAALLGRPWQDAIGPAPREDPEDWRPVLRRARRIWEV